MANKRLIYQDMFEDDEIGTMPRDVRFLWVGLISAVADDQGRLLDNASLIKSKVFMYDTDISANMVDNWLAMLENAGMIIRYVKNGKRIIQIVNWWVYQAPSWASESRFVAPDHWVDRVKVHTKGNQISSKNWDLPGGLPKELHSTLPNQLHSNECEVKGECECEGDVKGEVEASATAEPQNVFTVYQNEIGNITPFIAEKLKTDIDDFTDGWVIDAIKVASAKQARNLPYVEAILKRWKTEGKDAGNKTRVNNRSPVGNRKIDQVQSVEEYNKKIIEDIANGTY
jgi:DnaD/phage-associated family protein